MYISRKICVSLVALVFGILTLSAQSKKEISVTWYKTLLNPRKMVSTDLAIEVGKRNLQQAREANDPSGQVMAYLELGFLSANQTHDYEQAVDYFIESLAVGDSSNLQKEQIFTLLAISRIFDEVGDYYKSADFLEQAMTLNKSVADPDIHVLILNELGKINSSLGKYDEASASYQQILADKDGLSKETQAEALFNLAHVFQQEKKNEQALGYYKQALALSRSEKDKKSEATTLYRIGEVYGALNNKSKEMANHVASFDVRRAIKDNEGIAESGNIIGLLYFQQKNYKRAIANLTIALHAGQDSQAQDPLRKTYELLSQCFSAVGQYKEALEYKDLFIAMNDFIDHEKNDQRILEAQSRYSLEKKQLLIEKLEVDNMRRQNELSDQQKIQNGLLAIIGLTSIIIGLTLYLYLNKRKSNALLTAANAKVSHQNIRLKELNSTKDKFFSILGHDLKAPLNSLSSFSNLLSNHLESLTQDEIKMLSKDLDKQLKNLFALLENLLEWARSQTGAIEFTPEKFDLTTLLEENKELLRGQAQNKKITVLGPENDNIDVFANKPSVQTVVRNLLSNAIKFTPEGGVIKLEIGSNDRYASVSVADTGVGMSEEIIQKLFRIDTKHSTKGTADEKGTGLGLILCKDFVEKNHGKLTVESEPGKGSVFHFTLPLQKQ